MGKRIETVMSLETMGESATVTVNGEWWATYVLKGGRFYTMCGRCGGQGFIRGFEHVENAICFACRGDSLDLYATDKDELFERIRPAWLRARRENLKRLAKAEAHEQKVAVLLEHMQANHANLFGWLESNRRMSEYDSETFASSLYDSMIGGYLSDAQIDAGYRAMAREMTDRMSAETSSHIGTVGEKITATGEVVFTSRYTTYYTYAGTDNAMVKIATPDGAIILKGTTAFLFDLEKGDTVTVVGKVKEHGEYKGEKQTVLVRPKRIA